MGDINESHTDTENKKRNFLLKFWWIFPILSIGFSILVIPLLSHELEKTASVFTVLVLLLLIIQLISFILCLIKKAWWRAVGAAICGIVSVFVSSYAMLFFAFYETSLPDLFGKEHPIPEGIIYNIPLDSYAYLDDSLGVCWKTEDIESSIDSLSEDGHLEIWNSFQGGIYKYSFYYPALPDGEVFLRCFEVTENIELSTPRLQKATTIKVRNHTDFGLIADKQQFSIYEGDWGDYYAARIEVWFRNASTGEETKLMEKIYRVEGWMR